MLVGTWTQRRPYEESDRIGTRLTGRRRGVAAELALPYFNDQMAEAIGAAMAASDAMLLGRVTYEEFAAFGLPRRLVTKIRRLRTT